MFKRFIFERIVLTLAQTTRVADEILSLYSYHGRLPRLLVVHEKRRQERDRVIRMALIDLEKAVVDTVRDEQSRYNYADSDTITGKNGLQRLLGRLNNCQSVGENRIIG
jgi:hypothetical protein